MTGCAGGHPRRIRENVPEGLLGRIGRLNLGPALLGLSAIWRRLQLCGGQGGAECRRAGADRIRHAADGGGMRVFSLRVDRRPPAPLGNARAQGIGDAAVRRVTDAGRFDPAVGLRLQPGPASLVAAVLATRPLFVFVATTVLSRVRWQLLDESLTPRALGGQGRVDTDDSGRGWGVEPGLVAAGIVADAGQRGLAWGDRKHRLAVSYAYDARYAADWR